MGLRDLVGRLDLSIYPEIGLVLFLGAFVAIVVRVLRQRGGESSRAASIPLEDEEFAGQSRREEDGHG